MVIAHRISTSENAVLDISGQIVENANFFSVESRPQKLCTKGLASRIVGDKWRWWAGVRGGGQPPGHCDNLYTKAKIAPKFRQAHGKIRLGVGVTMLVGVPIFATSRRKRREFSLEQPKLP